MRTVLDVTLEDARLKQQSLMRKKEVRLAGLAVAILAGITWPVLLYFHIYTIMSGRFRFHHPNFALVLGPGLGLIVSCLVVAWARQLLRNELPVKGLAIMIPCLFLAVAMSSFDADTNYWWYMKSYLVYNDLATYTNIDPSADKGQSYMDAGQVYFREGSAVQRTNMQAFRSDSVYCVAPITIQPLWNAGSPDQVQLGGPAIVPPSGTVDFWAVGRDCCSTTSNMFNCSDAAEEKARAGLRLVRDDERPFYLLAVQAWVAKNCPLDDNTAEGRASAAPLVCLPARHPLFFYWVEDPLHDVGQYYVKSKRLFRMNAYLFFMLDVFINVGLAWLLTKLGLK